MGVAVMNKSSAANRCFQTNVQASPWPVCRSLRAPNALVACFKRACCRLEMRLLHASNVFVACFKRARCLLQMYLLHDLNVPVGCFKRAGFPVGGVSPAATGVYTEPLWTLR
eukprot:363096-Chlamydomonas_euryale.AAC.17